MAQRHQKVTLIGDKGRPFRFILAAAALVGITVLVAVLTKPETSYMNTPEIARIEDMGVMYIGVRDDMPGFGYEGEGLEVELARRLAERILPEKGADAAELITVTGQTAGPKLDDDSVAAVVALMRTGAYEKYAYSVAYYKDPTVLLVREGDENAELAGATIGAVQNTYSYTRLTAWITENSPEDAVEADKYAHVKLYASYPDMLAALLAPDSPIAAAAIQEAYTFRYGEEYACSRHVTEVGSVSYAVACSADYPAIAAIATLVINEMRADGSLDALIAEYGLNP